jgi:hypothetical protein
MRHKIGKGKQLFFKKYLRSQIPLGFFVLKNYDFQQVIFAHWGSKPLFLLNQGYFCYLCTPVDSNRY